MLCTFGHMNLFGAVANSADADTILVMNFIAASPPLFALLFWSSLLMRLSRTQEVRLWCKINSHCRQEVRVQKNKCIPSASASQLVSFYMSLDEKLWNNQRWRTCIMSSFFSTKPLGSTNANFQKMHPGNQTCL